MFSRRFFLIVLVLCLWTGNSSFAEIHVPDRDASSAWGQHPQGIWMHEGDQAILDNNGHALSVAAYWKDLLGVESSKQYQILVKDKARFLYACMVTYDRKENVMETIVPVMMKGQSERQQIQRVYDALAEKLGGDWYVQAPLQWHTRGNQLVGMSRFIRLVPYEHKELQDLLVVMVYPQQQRIMTALVIIPQIEEREVMQQLIKQIEDKWFSTIS